MIYMAAALYCEAKPWIMRFSLKKDLNSKRFQIFYNDFMYLILTKTGKVNAAIAVTELFWLHPPAASDLFINVGIVSSTDPGLSAGSGFLCHSILDADSSRTFYPDLLFTHDAKEADLITVSKPWRSAKISEYQLSAAASEFQKTSVTLPDSTSVLIDMEASGIYLAASHFIGQHQMFFYKIVSDHGLDESLSPDSVSELTGAHMDELMELLQSILPVLRQQKEYEFTQQEQQQIAALSDALFFSVSMTYQLKQLLLYSKLTGHNLYDYLHTYLEQLSEHPCTSKKEGKHYLESIRNELL